MECSFDIMFQDSLIGQKGGRIGHQVFTKETSLSTYGSH